MDFTPASMSLTSNLEGRHREVTLMTPLASLSDRRPLPRLGYRSAICFKFKLSSYELECVHHWRLRHIDHSLKWRVEIEDNKHGSRGR